jgi:hypothetical protein
MNRRPDGAAPYPRIIVEVQATGANRALRTWQSREFLMTPACQAAVSQAYPSSAMNAKYH